MHNAWPTPRASPRRAAASTHRGVARWYLAGFLARGGASTRSRQCARGAQMLAFVAKSFFD
jgi:hypothetical protein